MEENNSDHYPKSGEKFPLSLGVHYCPEKNSYWEEKLNSGELRKPWLCGCCCYYTPTEQTE
jgi:hypothetical protein